jgi:ribosome biogenesis ATPase
MYAVKRIFHQLGKLESSLDTMMIDDPSNGTMIQTGVIDVVQPDKTQDTKDTQPSLQTISAFLRNHPKPLTQEELEPLAITQEDFINALAKVQPSSKREGFATIPDVTWADVGALNYVRDELRMAVVEPIRHPEFFRKVGIVRPSGVLLWGPPGCGKTLLAKAVANESQTNFISVKGPELLNKASINDIFINRRKLTIL